LKEKKAEFDYKKNALDSKYKMFIAGHYCPSSVLTSQVKLVVFV